MMRFLLAFLLLAGSAFGQTFPSGRFNNLRVDGTLTGVGVTAMFAAPGPIGSTTASTGAFTTLSASSTVAGAGFTAYLASPPAIGGTTSAAGTFSTLTSASAAITGGSINNTSMGVTTRIPAGARFNNLDLSNNPAHTTGTVTISNLFLTSPTISSGSTGAMVTFQPEVDIYGTSPPGAGAHWVAIKPYIQQVAASAIVTSNVSQPSFSQAVGATMGSLYGTIFFHSYNGGTTTDAIAFSDGTATLNGPGTVTNWTALRCEARSVTGGGSIGSTFCLDNKNTAGLVRTVGPVLLGSTTINASARLQIDSTTAGFLPPRMTTTEKNAIASPATGLVVYDTTLGKLCVYTGSAWQTITSASIEGTRIFAANDSLPLRNAA